MVDSYCNAYRRARLVEKKLASDQGLKTRFHDRIKYLLDNDYARKLQVEENNLRLLKLWYLPIFGVDNPNKKKLRLVYDAAATSAGHSLNDYLLSGPNLLESLLGIMFRFRERPIGLTGDIKDMFLRIKISPEEQHAFRFLWRDEPDMPMEKYVMTSLIFGANCSPFIAHYIKNKNAQQYVTKMPEAVEAIVKSHFVDDYIDCFDDTQTAMRLMREVSYIHLQGGFEIRNWTSNDTQVCSAIPNETLSSAAVKFKDEDENLYERTLGLLWYPSIDAFGFNLLLTRIPEKIMKCEKRPTKRELLRIVMSIFDVYGLLAPFTMKAKIILQNCWKIGLGWDEEINSSQFKNFTQWLSEFEDIKLIRLPRWYFRTASPTTTTARACESLELHVFCDGSPTATSTVAYWRTHTDGEVCVSFIACKSRVTPVKTISVPRLELQSAVLGCRLAETIQKEHRIKPIRRFFWTDSTVVLHWIKNENRNYKTFVANRLGEIDELSEVNEWHYVSTDKNIADVATKHNTYKLHNNCEWFRGPRFLYEDPDNWIKSSEKEKTKLDEDILEMVQHIQETAKQHLPVPDPGRFSSWLRLLRSTATVLLFLEKCKKSSTTEIDAQMIQRAEILVLQHAQVESFEQEIQLLKNNEPLQVNSRLRTLTPYLDEWGLLRVGSRVKATSDVSALMKEPIILDGHHTVARLITKFYHDKTAHSNNELVVNELRQKYWLLNLRPTVRTVASKCLYCRIRKATPTVPRMADLPAARLAHHQRVFSHCGVDLFGPMEVVVGRRRELRYGVLFTCMTVRAIHIELVPSLTTDSFIMALRRMAARRGWPSHMYSDNGTNLRGADLELKKSYQELDHDQIGVEMSNRGVQWTFNSPVSPHKGGSWERLIRTVKTALRVVLKERAPKEEVLLTLLCEVENMVNGRPLTHVSVDPSHIEALTPNHFLIGTSSSLPVVGVFDDADLCLRKMWRTSQRLADMFWQRWVKEFLPNLLPRQKWFSENGNLKPGDVVIIVDPNSSRGTWPKGIVERACPSKDGRVRTVEIKTAAGNLIRPVTRLALLPTSD